MRRLFLPLTDEEFATIKASASAKKITVTSLVRKALKLTVAKRGRPVRKTGTIAVTLKYAGRGKPLAFSPD